METLGAELVRDEDGNSRLHYVWPDAVLVIRVIEHPDEKLASDLVRHIPSLFSC